MHGFLFINKRLLISCDTGIYAIIIITLLMGAYLHFLHCPWEAIFIARAWKSGAILDSPCPSVVHSVIILVSAQYLENELTESDQILYAY